VHKHRTLRGSFIPVLVALALSLGLATMPVAGQALAHASGMPRQVSSSSSASHAATSHAAPASVGRSSRLAPTLGARVGGPGHFMTNQAPTCDTSWKAAVSGSWYDPSKWTNGVPDFIDLGNNQPGLSACITVPGTYTVTAAGDCPSTFCPGQGDVAPGATALTLGASTGTERLVVESQFSDSFCDSADGTMVITGDGSIGPGGFLDLVGGTGSCVSNGNNVPLNNTTHLSIGGTLTNSGQIRTDQGTSKNTCVFVSGNLTNLGTITVAFSAFYNDGNSQSNPLTLDNAGTISLRDGTFLGDGGQNFMGGTTIINDTGGSILNSGHSNAGFVYVSPFSNNVFDQGGGTTSPAVPHPLGPAVIVNGATLNYTGTGASSIVLEGNSSLTGDIASGQNLTMETNDTRAGATSVTAAASFTNAGDITQTEVQGPGCGSCTEAFSLGGTLTNTGTLEVDPGTGASINRFLAGNITNSGGTIDINTNVIYNNGNSSPLTLDNGGRINLADGAVLDIPSFADTTVVNDTGGSIVNTGHSNAGFVKIENNDNAFQEGAGTISPSSANPAQPAVALAATFSNPTLDYTGTGAGTIEIQGNVTVQGNLGAHQNLVIQPVDGCGSGQTSTASTPDSLTNAGAITLRPSICGGNPSVAFNIGNSGTLTNTGTISSLVPSGGSAAINGNLTNNGALNVASGDGLALNGALTNYDGNSGTLTGGKYLLSGTFTDRDTGLTAQGILADASSITLSGGSFLDSNGANALRNLGSIASGALLGLSNGSNLTTTVPLTNAGLISTGAGSTLNLGGSFTQNPTGRWSTQVAGISSFGRIAANGGATLAGILTLVDGSLNEPVGTTLAPLTASSRTGTFSNIGGVALSGGKFLDIVYTRYDFTLTVVATQISATPSSDSPGQTFTVNGSGFTPGETVSIALGSDPLTSAVADADGNISQTEKVPSLASGNYTLTAKGQTSFIKVTSPFTVS